MDIDAYASAHAQEWDQLERLGKARAADAGAGRMADELIARYQGGATDLSALQTVYGRTNETDWLSVALSRARQRFTRARRNSAKVYLDFFVTDLPAALYRIRWWTLAACLFTVALAVLTFLWHGMNPGLIQTYGTESQLKQYAENDFVNYYSEFSEGGFSAKVFTNNAWIAAQCIAFGITGVWPVWMLAQNAISLGTSAALINHVGGLGNFFLWISPHGMLELTMIFVAAGAGMFLFWSWVVPGAQTRMEALASAGRSVVMVAVATTIFLFISGLIEGFITRQPWPWPVKIGIGAIALAAFLAYMLVLGRRATRAGHTGDLSVMDAGATRIHAA